MNPAEDYIFNQSEPYRSMMMHLQMIIERTVPEAQLLYKFKIPYYYINGIPFCYCSRSKNYIDLGFAKGQYLTVFPEHLVTANRKVIKSLRYYDLTDIDDVVLVAILRDARAVQN
ncbi:MAG: 2-dehydro-3-deoxyphosphooctonate aldolase [Flavobacteriaceae bacterium]|nr:MAG: 2-dehydro-3-deoxyphosphooctonate aldolase [Flavobacteriaceae bacterium]